MCIAFSNTRVRPNVLSDCSFFVTWRYEWTDCLEDKTATGGKLPTIIPVVIYQGGKKWRAIDSFLELVDFPSQEFREYAPDFRFEFFDIPGISREKLEESKDRIVLHFYLAILRSLQSPELKDILPGLIKGLFEAVGAKTGMELIGVFLRYIVRASRSIKKEDVMDIMDNIRWDYEEIKGTLAEEWLNEGIEKGKAENTKKLLIVLAQDKFGTLSQDLTEDIEKIESLEELDNLFKKTLRCDSLERFRGWVQKVLQKSDRIEAGEG